MTTNTNTLMSATQILSDMLRACGSVGLVRLSSAQSGTKYSYWGAPRYELALTRDGRPMVRAEERASSERRSRRLAEQDATERAQAEGRVYVGQCRVGTLRDTDAEAMLRLILPR